MQVQEIPLLKPIDIVSPFDIIEFCKSSRNQISPVEYLKLNPKELDRLVKFVKGNNASAQVGTTQQLVNLASMPQYQESTRPVSLETSNDIVGNQTDEMIPIFEPKPDPFYVSLFVNGHRLNNCIIDFGASDNIMSSIAAKALGLSLTKTFGRCYSMDSKQIPLVGQIKDEQVTLVVHPDKCVKLTILVANILASYGMVLSTTFCKDLGGEIKMDWSQAAIPIGKRQVILQREPKSKFTVFPMDDPEAQILYQERNFGNYMILSNNGVIAAAHQSQRANELLGMEFDGSFSASGSGEGVVLIPPSGTCPFHFPLSYNL